MALKSEPFEISISGNYLPLLLPIQVIQPFLDRNIKRVQVTASFENKELQFYGAFQKRKKKYYMMFSKRYQKELGVFPNDYFTIQLFEDNSKYGVEMPQELEAVFESDIEAFQIFESFTPGKKRGIIYIILKYKGSQTRISKSLLLCENLKGGVRNNLELLKSF